MTLNTSVVIMAILLVALLCFAWHKTNSLWKAWIITLITGKVVTVLFWAFGLDRPLFTISLISRKTGYVIKSFTITACGITFISFLITLIATLSWPYIMKVLPREIKYALRSFEVREA